MNIVDLPDDVLVLLFKNYVNCVDLIAISNTCIRFRQIIDSFNVWSKYLKKYPLLDFSYPNGYSEQFFSSKSSQEKYQNGYRLSKYLNLMGKNFSTKVFYSFAEKMIPHIQLDDESNDLLGYQTLMLSNANKLCCLNVDHINSYNPSRFQLGNLSSRHQSFYSIDSRSNNGSSNGIKISKKIKIFNSHDIRSFTKKSSLVVCFSENKVNIQKLIKSSSLNPSNSYELKFLDEIKELDGKINCADFSIKLNKLIYGCSNGLLKIHNYLDMIDCSKYNRFQSIEDYEDVHYDHINVGDRILRCVISPSLRNIAVGSAGVFPFRDQNICPIRIYDFEKLKETHLLKPSKQNFKFGAGVLALSFIDENLVMSAGYDTFIRIFDLRSNKCVQWLEEPEDMSIYCVCCSKYYGLISGNDRQSLIRYWDRRQNKVIRTFFASNSNSSVYSLQCSPESIYAAWDHGVTLINYE